MLAAVKSTLRWETEEKQNEKKGVNLLRSALPAFQKFVCILVVVKSFFVNVNFQVVGMNTQGISQPDRCDLPALNEQVDERTTDMQNLGNFIDR